jgi:hypothetical protein
MTGRSLGALGFLMVFASLTRPACALFTTVPEIDPGSAVSALTLLTGGVMVLASRIRRK